ncbi:MAG: NADH-quinone oxidoreductase subunit A [Planctomycetes bacterium]|nr:NADH-quinone oxidoreductase subunit A [Planctomycetota bacterium]
MPSEPATSLLIFLAVAQATAAGMLVAARLLRVRARAPARLKDTTYECGETATGVTWVRFHARYYVVALFFVIFDLEAVFLLPWALGARDLGPGGFVAVAGFVGVLMLGWFWALRKGSLRWQ